MTDDIRADEFSALFAEAEEAERAFRLTPSVETQQRVRDAKRAIGDKQDALYVHGTLIVLHEDHAKMIRKALARYVILTNFDVVKRRKWEGYNVNISGFMRSHITESLVQYEVADPDDDPIAVLERMRAQINHLLRAMRNKAVS